jgi:hypothetical protein
VIGKRALRTYSWLDVKNVATEAFSVWADQPELTWAEKAWQMVVTSGLANYDSELSRCEVAIRFIALAGIYRNFCEQAFEESGSTRSLYYDWSGQFEVPSFRIGQLIGRQADWETDVDNEARRVV